MANRLTKIVTRTGDDGTTGLADGSRIPKDSARIVAIGEIDELNSNIGMVICATDEHDIRDCLLGVQHRLFDLGGELSMPGYEKVSQEHVSAIEQLIAQFNAPLPPLKEFILPGGERAAAICHMARTVCRRAERSVVTLAQHENISPMCQRYLNRLSDLLFVLCRVFNQRAGYNDIFWQRDK